jgi:glycosyltransferase involved in cell wall biosynthesis
MRQNISSELVYNGINISSVKEKNIVSKEQNTFRILQISRLMHEEKGQDILIRAVFRLCQKFPEVDICLDFIGTGPSENFLRKLCIEHKLENNVRFLGEKDRNYIYDSIADYDLLVQPSRYEGFGLTVIEGLAAKVPVLSSNNNGPEEILESGKYGFMFENGDVDDCYNLLKKIYTQYDSLFPIVERSSKYVKENFDISTTAQKYLDIYKEITSL